MPIERSVLQRHIMDNATITLAQVQDREYNLTATQKASGLRQSHLGIFAEMMEGTKTVLTRFQESRSVMYMKIGKQGRQGDIGYMCRRPRTCAANYTEGTMSTPVGCGDERRVVQRRREYDFDDDDYGNATTRAVSMLCKRLMQEMLTTNSGDYSEEVVSPIHCFLTGEGKFIVVMRRPVGTATDEIHGDHMDCLCVTDATEGIKKVRAMIRDGFELEMCHCSAIVSGLHLDEAAVRTVCTNSVEFIMMCSNASVTRRGASH